ncbi:MAG: hypothetical protein INR62_13315 [Rhodospirillales bacterium]|nr:hypothetical protein [Acetobacter sp.]
MVAAVVFEQTGPALVRFGWQTRLVHARAWQRSFGISQEDGAGISDAAMYFCYKSHASERQFSARCNEKMMSSSDFQPNSF